MGGLGQLMKGILWPFLSPNFSPWLSLGPYLEATINRWFGTTYEGQEVQCSLLGKQRCTSMPNFHKVMTNS